MSVCFQLHSWECSWGLKIWRFSASGKQAVCHLRIVPDDHKWACQLREQGKAVNKWDSIPLSASRSPVLTFLPVSCFLLGPYPRTGKLRGMTDC